MYVHCLFDAGHLGTFYQTASVKPAGVCLQYVHEVSIFDKPLGPSCLQCLLRRKTRLMLWLDNLDIWNQLDLS